MSVLSPSGQEHARTIEHDVSNATRDDFESERGARRDDWEDRRGLLLAKHAVRETKDALSAVPSGHGRTTNPEPYHPDDQHYDEWELWAEYRKNHEQIR